MSLQTDPSQGASQYKNQQTPNNIKNVAEADEVCNQRYF